MINILELKHLKIMVRLTNKHKIKEKVICWRTGVKSAFNRTECKNKNKRREKSTHNSDECFNECGRCDGRNFESVLPAAIIPHM